MTDYRAELASLKSSHSLSNAQIADHLRTAESTVRAWLNGQNPTPSWAVELLRAKLAG